MNHHPRQSPNSSSSTIRSQVSAQDFHLRMSLLAERANKYLEYRGYQVSQHNGQRISILQNPAQQINNARASSRKGSKKPAQQFNEVFVGKLPRDVFEDELLPLMEKAGKVIMIRLMMDFSGTNRGFGYFKYETSGQARLAIEQLDQSIIRMNCPPIGLLLSFDNRRLYFGNLPPKCTKELLLKELNELLKGVVDVSFPEASCRNQNEKRFALVTFESHNAATQARRILLPGNMKVFNRHITVDWAKPEVPPENAPLAVQPARNSCMPKICHDLVDLNNNIDNSSRVISIYNLNLTIISLEKLKRIFQMADRLEILSIEYAGHSCINIEYKTSDHADLMLESLIMFPFCFEKLALPNLIVTGARL